MAVNGTMKGRIEEYRLTDNELIATFDFVSSRVGRLDYEDMQVYGDMTSPRQIGMGFNLVDKDQPSGTFEFPKDGGQVKRIWYSNTLGGHVYPARQGVVVLQNHAPAEVRINGKLTFTTDQFDGRYFKVDVTYAIDGMGEMT
ncbi:MULTISPECIES: hypothetical protein [unclassified Pseudomonas]|uniref:hypothetical protein n=1 Tax=unclassified Pseudomonas TaxID=196821 RepID=UPI002A35EDE2|nr:MULTISPECIES: hypothetical protein [unclassified Pseudomonas]MDX9672702.1 hypothetical protein [Pseudomonas sp. P8_250]WPN33357.1 hypothetical protein QMK53_14130 [Pseudomonas sp. P8_139]WPN39457.1 hypothetical protein QMK55_17245 [Pseudomonas sp. P8_229]